MRRVLPLLTALLICIGGRAAKAQLYTNVFASTNVTASAANTFSNNSPSYFAGYAYLPNIPFHIAENGIAPGGTNSSLTVSEQFSLDGVNWVTIPSTSFNPGVTNPIYASYAIGTVGGNSAIPVYTRIAYLATNNVNTFGVVSP